MIHINRNMKHKSLYNRLESVCKAHSIRMLDYCHGQSAGMAIEILGASKEEQAYNALLVKLVEQREKELEGRGL